VFCGEVLESVDHLFITCNLISSVWFKLLWWLGIQFVSPYGISRFLHAFLGPGLVRKNKLLWLLIWHATVWFIWDSRNNLIFTTGTVFVDSLVDKVKLSP
jgi:hypothetical protein